MDSSNFLYSLQDKVVKPILKDFYPKTNTETKELVLIRLGYLLGEKLSDENFLTECDNKLIMALPKLNNTNFNVQYGLLESYSIIHSLKIEEFIDDDSEDIFDNLRYKFIDSISLDQSKSACSQLLMFLKIYQDVKLNPLEQEILTDKLFSTISKIEREVSYYSFRTYEEFDVAMGTIDTELLFLKMTSNFFYYKSFLSTLCYQDNTLKKYAAKVYDKLYINFRLFYTFLTKYVKHIDSLQHELSILLCKSTVLAREVSPEIIDFTHLRNIDWSPKMMQVEKDRDNMEKWLLLEDLKIVSSDRVYNNNLVTSLSNNLDLTNKPYLDKDVSILYSIVLKMAQRNTHLIPLFND